MKNGKVEKVGLKEEVLPILLDKPKCCKLKGGTNGQYRNETVKTDIRFRR